MNNKLYVFDFDGTLTSRDTLLLFIRHVFGQPRMLLGLMLYSPLIALMKLHVMNNGKVKQKFFAHFFKGMDIQRFQYLCEEFAKSNKKVIRTEALAYIDKEVGENDAMTIVSASVDNWVEVFNQCWIGGKATVIGTQVEVVDGHLTGRFLTPNCYGDEKVRRLTEVYPANGNRTVVAFGDSRGDKALLQYADESHYKPFRDHRTQRSCTWRKRLCGFVDNGIKGEIVRFGVVGLLATAIQYAVYLSLRHMLTPTVSMTISYLVSFVFNFVASTRYTFHVKANARHGAGFLLSHAINMSLQLITLNLFIFLGVSEQLAPIPMFCVCVPINFVLVRFFLKR